MKIIMLLLLLSGCGFTSRSNELIGQAKRVSNETPIICSDFMAADLSLGVLRNGIGSMSTQDLWFYIKDKAHFEILKDAAENGKLVRVTYDIRRLSFCVPDHWLTSVEVVE